MRSPRLRAAAATLAVGTLVLASAVVTTVPAAAAPVGGPVTFNATGAVQTWQVPAGVTEVDVTLAGAQGGHGYGGGGGGATLSGVLEVTPGETLSIVVGSAGANGEQYIHGGGGGGGTFVYTTADQDGLLAAAGGGGGAGSNNFALPSSITTSGVAGGDGGGAGGVNGLGGAGGPEYYDGSGGGGGLLTNGGGSNGGAALANGAGGGHGDRRGGFGGGGGTSGAVGGGGGGYSGGGGGHFASSAGGGGGGGSYFAGTLTDAVPGNQPGNGYVTFDLPGITSHTPTVGKASDRITLTGVGLTGATATVGGVAATVNSSSETRLVVTAPSRNPLPTVAQPIVVTTASGAILTVPDAFSYAAQPTLTAVSNQFGTVYGGTVVTLTGTGFTHATAVTFGGVKAASFTINSDTAITATTPAGTGAVGITVTSPGGSSAPGQVYFYSLPAISIAPPVLPATEQGVPYSQTLSASGAASGPYSFAVTAGALPAGLILSGAGVLSGTATANGTFSFTVTATSPDLYSGSRAYTLQVASALPTITSVTPGIGGSGTALTITGSHLSGATVTVDGEPAAADPSASNTATSLTVLVPTLTTTGAKTVGVTNVWGNVTATDAFTYLPVPTVTGVTPSSVVTYGGAEVTITGTGFQGGPTVTFGGIAATSVTVNSATSITATVPAAPVGSADVIITTPGGQSSAFPFNMVAPDISVSPATLPAAKQGVAYTQTLTAAGAQSGPYAFELSSGTLPAGLILSTAGTVSGTPTVSGEFPVTVTARSVDGFDGTASYTLSVESSAPTIASISRLGDGAGARVTITGTDLGGATVSFGGVPATVDPDAVNTATSLTVLAPTPVPTTVGAVVDVTVTSPWGIRTAPAAFTYPTPTVVLTPDFEVGDDATGSVATLRAGGFAAGHPVEVVVHSTPTTIFAGVTDASGALVATVALPPLTEGSHKLVVSAGTASDTVWFAVDAAGTITAISESGVVENPLKPAAVKAIPVTGYDTKGPLGLALVLLLAGAAGIVLPLRLRHSAKL